MAEELGDVCAPGADLELCPPQPERCVETTTSLERSRVDAADWEQRGTYVLEEPDRPQETLPWPKAARRPGHCVQGAV